MGKMFLLWTENSQKGGKMEIMEENLALGAKILPKKVEKVTNRRQILRATRIRSLFVI